MKSILLVFSILVAIPSLAQDIHYAQFVNAPLNINPANTGLIQGDYRAVANYNNEWNSVTVPYTSASFSVDMNLLKSKSKRSSLGFGVLRSDRMAGDGYEYIRRSGASLAYQRRLNKNTERPSMLSIGLQTSLVQKKGEIAVLYYPGPDPIKHSGGKYQVSNYLDYNAGILFTGYINKRISIYSGLSYNHFTQPVENILGDNFKVRPRVSTQLGTNYVINKRLNFLFSSLYTQQGKSYDFILGGAVAYNFSPKQTDKRRQLMASLGTWYNYNDALVPYVSAEWLGFRLGLSASFQKNILTEVGEVGMFELSLQYNGLFGNGRNF